MVDVVEADPARITQSEEDEEEEEEEEEERAERECLERELPGLSATRRSQLHPESLEYLLRLTGAERTAAISTLSQCMSAYDFRRQNNILKNQFVIDTMSEGQTGTDIIDIPTGMKGFLPSSKPVTSKATTSKTVTLSKSSVPSSDSQHTAPKPSNDSFSPPSDDLPALGEMNTDNGAMSSTSSTPTQFAAEDSSTQSNTDTAGSTPSPPTQFAAEDISAQSNTDTDGDLPSTPSSPTQLAAQGSSMPQSNQDTDGVLSTSGSLSPPALQAPSLASNVNIQVDKFDWPKWLSDVTINAWTALERNYKFSNPNGSSATFNASGRPSAISWWFCNRKPVLRAPPDHIIGCLIINENDRGDWSNLIRPGQCGILTVLLCLFWWYKCLPAPSQDWNSTLQDVSWVVNELVKATKNRTQARKRKLSPPPEEQGPRTRMRTRQG
ncbi:hypothetical protein DFJ43DRAFT_1152295 [Lentinula guzmanii]|uniref:Uncharacterized protein n=1 Tax=Lentinula guzmanii TaxID=2804957 RepID=A0AA38MVM4_9AGAR|nr:hypothetical protein DFJ43DRAFT_1152295 [Lentinula guzmanii]